MAFGLSGVLLLGCHTTAANLESRLECWLQLLCLSCPPFAGCGLVTAFFAMPVILLAALLDELSSSSQAYRLASRWRQTDSLRVQLWQSQSSVSRWGQAGSPRCHLCTPVLHILPSTTPDSADQPVFSSIVFTCRFLVEYGQQAAFLATIQRLRGFLGLVPVGTHEADSSAAVPSASTIASAVSLSMPAADRTSTSRCGTAIESEDQPSDVCVVCMDADKDWFCLPCRHLAMCGTYISRLAHTTR